MSRERTFVAFEGTVDELAGLLQATHDELSEDRETWHNQSIMAFGAGLDGIIYAVVLIEVEHYIAEGETSMAQLGLQATGQVNVVGDQEDSGG